MCIPLTPVHLEFVKGRTGTGNEGGASQLLAPGGINCRWGESEIGGGGLCVKEVCTTVGCSQAIKVNVLLIKKTVRWKNEADRTLECVCLFRRLLVYLICSERSRLPTLEQFLLVIEG